MFRKEQCEVLKQRSLECEEMSKLARDGSIRQKFAELAIQYRDMAERIQRLDYMETRIK